ncbi:MAG: hypothetical protein HQM12_21045 [SAR324 cluster bacterium]|nr:hypothetical protein [SAR324 cluster bacterium]
MHAVEFKARIRNGLIEIPDQYRNELKETVKVIVLSEEIEEDFDMIEALLKNPVILEEFEPLTREDIHARIR